MYHVECIDIRETDPRYSYADYACLTANNMYNVANYYTRNLMTGLSKPEKQRTPNERDVIELVRKSIPDINKSLQGYSSEATLHE